jgi:hypothetical protein
MNAIRVLALAAFFMTSQAYALTAYEKNHGCNHDVGDCPDQGTSGGGGGGDYGPSGFLGSVSDGNGGTVDFYSDSGGEWWVENHSDGTSQVGWDESAGPKMHKKMPQQSGGKRPKYTKAMMTPAAKKSYAAAQQKAAADAAKAAADKAAADKAAAEKAAKYANEHPTVPLATGGAVSSPGARKKP